jgi:hypothetical protein
MLHTRKKFADPLDFDHLIKNEAHWLVPKLRVDSVENVTVLLFSDTDLNEIIDKSTIENLAVYSSPPICSRFGGPDGN